VGGLAGQAVSIAKSYATGSVSGTGYVGGLAGNVSSSIATSYATGNVSGSGNSSNIGGLAGRCSGSVANCYATGAVTASGGYGSIGGLTGNGGSISASYASGTVSGSSIYYYVGGLTGIGSGNISNCYFHAITGGPGGAGGTVNGTITGLNIDAMKEKSSFSGFNFSTVWSIREGETSPYLQGVGNALVSEASELLPSVATLYARAGGGLLRIGGLRAGERFAVYNIRGQRVCEGRAADGEQTVPLAAKGVYIVVSGGQSVKVIIGK
jgi:hypothetical protein